MREIKFRAWDKSEKRWVANRDSLDLYHSASANCFLFDNDNYDLPEDIEFLQYTGLKDKNGKEIYEGDIVNVVFNDGTKYDNPNQVYYEHGAFAVGMGYLHDTNDIEVIGNIYENP